MIEHRTIYTAQKINSIGSIAIMTSCPKLPI